MAKKSAVEKNNRRMRIVAAKGARRDKLRAIMRDKSISMAGVNFGRLTCKP